MARLQRKGWQQLSPAYRYRLARNGITEESYSNNVSLHTARGHRRPVQTVRESNNKGTSGDLAYTIGPMWDALLPAEQKRLQELWTYGFMTSGPLALDRTHGFKRAADRAEFQHLLKNYGINRLDSLTHDQWERFRLVYSRQFGFTR